MRVRIHRNGFKRKRRSKYNNTRINRDGFKFDSKKEYGRYLELKMMEEKGFIRNLKIHPSFKFPMGFKYIADFSYFAEADQQIIIEDVKGVKTSVFKLKMKCFEYFYPNLELRLT